MPLLLLVCALIVLPTQNVNVLAETDCDLTYNNAIDGVPNDTINDLSKIIIYNNDISSYTYLTASSSIFNLPDIDNYFRFASTKLSPSGEYVLTPYLNNNKNLLIYFHKISNDPTISLDVSDGSWQGDSINSPYWLNSVNAVVPLRFNNEFRFDLIHLPLGSRSEISVNFDDITPIPSRTPVLSPNLSKLAYIGLQNNGDAFVILDIPQKRILFETLFPPVNSIGLVSWSPKGNYVAFQHNNNKQNLSYIIEIVTANGAQQGFLDIGQTSPSSTFNSEILQWSPDETSLIYIDQHENDTWSQVVFNLNNKSRTKICIPSEAFWSTDSKYIFLIAFDHSTQVGNLAKGIFVYDIANKKLYSINYPNLLNIGSVLGWSN